ncbi:MAG TPA: hypothetical protein VHB48_11655 [Chitinophagaceae bacterium]|nr:hypothetical protein [Chitinophagaceae bacterium]
MKKHQLRQAIEKISYKDCTDLVVLRYLLLHTLAMVAGQHRATTHSARAFALHQLHKKLEIINTALREKCRKGEGSKAEFEKIKLDVLHCMEHSYPAAAIAAVA